MQQNFRRADVATKCADWLLFWFEDLRLARCERFNRLCRDLKWLSSLEAIVYKCWMVGNWSQIILPGIEWVDESWALFRYSPGGDLYTFVDVVCSSPCSCTPFGIAEETMPEELSDAADLETSLGISGPSLKKQHIVRILGARYQKSQWHQNDIW